MLIYTVVCCRITKK